METGVNREYLERVLKQGGFIEGPFETIKKVKVMTYPIHCIFYVCPCLYAAG